MSLPAPPAPPANALPLQRAARAKINLFLRVVGRRADGYHLLQSLVGFTDLSDRLSVAAADTLTLQISGPFAAQCAAADDNLVLRAGRLLANEAGRTLGAALTLVKNIPVAAGLGGGSADAAATLLLLRDHWGLALAPARLHDLALRLGADVPVCLGRRATLVGGVGEVLAPAPALPQAGVVLANPRRALPTEAVFKQMQPPYQDILAPPRGFADSAELAKEIGRYGNGLTVAARALCPPIGAVLSALAALPDALVAQMSGSGATCFALFKDAAAARLGGAALARQHADWFVQAGALME